MTSVNATSSTDAARQALIRGMLASGISVNTMMPSNNAEDATRSFRFATDKDPLMCDAWLGRILTGEDSAKILYGAWNAGTRSAGRSADSVWCHRNSCRRCSTACS